MKKTKEEIWEECFAKDLSWTESALGAMQEYADLKIKEELEDLVESMKETHYEYHLEIIEGRLSEYKNKCK